MLPYTRGRSLIVQQSLGGSKTLLYDTGCCYQDLPDLACTKPLSPYTLWVSLARLSSHVSEVAATNTSQETEGITTTGMIMHVTWECFEKEFGLWRQVMTHRIACLLLVW